MACFSHCVIFNMLFITICFKLFSFQILLPYRATNKKPGLFARTGLFADEAY
jgi:hypothetical protein